MRSNKDLLDILKEYIKEDYARLIEIAKVNNDEYKEIEEELEELLEDINRQE